MDPLDPHQLYPLHSKATVRAAALAGRQKPYSPKAVLSWAKHGQEGVRLQIVETPDTKLTCDQWILDFWAELARVRQSKVSPKAKPKRKPRPRGVAAQRRGRSGRGADRDGGVA